MRQLCFAPVSLRQPGGRGFCANPWSATITRSCIPTVSRAKSFSAARSRRTLYTDFGFPLCQVFRQRTILQWLPPDAFQPRHIRCIFNPFQKLLVIFNRQNHRDRFAMMCHNFRFSQHGLHRANVSRLRCFDKLNVTRKAPRSVLYAGLRLAYTGENAI